MMAVSAKWDLNSIYAVSLLERNRTWAILSHLQWRSMNVVVCGSTGDHGVPSQTSHS